MTWAAGFGWPPFSFVERRMPYKPTGRPPGRPRKNAVEPEKPPEKKRRLRARKAFRAYAAALNPSPFVPIYDSHGRLRHAPRHTFVKA
jgi:hypothetical protein